LTKKCSLKNGFLEHVWGDPRRATGDEGVTTVRVPDLREMEADPAKVADFNEAIDRATRPRTGRLRGRDSS